MNRYCDWCGNSIHTLRDEKLHKVTFSNESKFEICSDCFNLWECMAFKDENVEELIIRLVDRI